ncbi:PA0069 family radical SAM protein [Pelagovum pacificum]|uniref:PA0069 family radical SAM protein n=1 Tax=Pelagovum pacificum TaxID=2588711 RepID=A0A5C5GCS0_9RHOB|nr:PA0069 family radical SAM protein [Pelagovum pacificum]QQA44276.1 PA0069 family radical SAM protein [Pelagovum pacificum]TNY32602.1 PA0069 family radical SAM protein [Pelagovum pacificum]
MSANDPIPESRRRGRASVSNATNRFERFVAEAVDDGWGRDEELPPLRTEVSVERPRRAITRNTSPDVHFDRSLNPYRGCEHGCIYCFARPSHAYLGLSPGLDFETRLVARPGIAEVLARELSKPGYTPAPLAIGTNTDAYQPVEKQRGVMRKVLEVLLEFRHPVTIVTKGTLIERDIDLLREMAAEGLASVGISVTTLDPAIARAMEPRVPSPARRLASIERLSTAGVPVRVMASPVVPALTDHELEKIIEAGAAAGAVAASAIVLRLPREVAGLFREWVEEAFPDRATRIMGRVRELHGGRDYDPEFGKRMRGQGPWADLLRARFLTAIRRHGLSETLPNLRNDLFRVPPRPGDQLSLF